MESSAKLAKLDELFGSYKAEWLRGKIFDFFATPSYFGSLSDHRPRVLQGGRGTGKTTVLRGLSYQGQYAILNKDMEQFDQNSYVGLYYRVNTNHARAFQGMGIGEEEWSRIFAHYFNLLFCREISIYLQWHREKCQDDEVLDARVCQLIATSLHIEKKIESFDTLCKEIENAMYAFQSDVNNIQDKSMPRLSMLGDPIKLFVEQALNLHQMASPPRMRPPPPRRCCAACHMRRKQFSARGCFPRPPLDSRRRPSPSSRSTRIWRRARSRGCAGSCPGWRRAGISSCTTGITPVSPACAGRRSAMRPRPGSACTACRSATSPGH